MQTDDCPHQSWRDRAREIRALGDQMHDRVARDEMLRLADKYECLAERAGSAHFNRSVAALAAPTFPA
jgi:hypothetical protein